MSTSESPISTAKLDSGYFVLSIDGGIVADPPGQSSGEAAIGVTLKAPLDKISEAIGHEQDHHVAEYTALIRGLELASRHQIRRLRVMSDSALIVNQLSGRSKVKADHLKDLHRRARQLLDDFEDAQVNWVPRKANKEADALASTPLGPLRSKPKPPIEDLPLD